MELLRRFSILAGIFCAASLYWFTDITPLYRIKIANFVEEQKEIGAEKRTLINMSKGRMGFPDELIEQAFKMTDRELYLSQMPLDVFFNEITKGRIIEVEGKNWDNFFNDLKKNINNAKSKGRQPFSTTSFFFRTDENPFNDLKLQFSADNQQFFFKDEFYFLKLKNSDDQFYLKLEFYYYDYNNFYSDKNTPSIFYPMGQYYIIFIVFGLLFYIFLPWPKNPANSISYTRWKIILLDSIYYLFTITIILLPFIIKHSTSLVFLSSGSYIIYSILILLYFLLKKIAFLSSYKFIINEDGFEIETYKGSVYYYYSDIVSYQKIINEPPTWYKILIILASLSGKFSSSVAISYRYTGIGIYLKEDRIVNLWLNSLLKKDAQEKYDNFIDILQNKNIKFIESQKVIKNISPAPGTYNTEIKEFNRSLKKGITKERTLTLLFLLLSVSCIISSIFIYISNLSFEKSHLPQNRIKMKQNIANSIPDSQEKNLNRIDKDVEWVKIFGNSQIITDAQKIIRAKKGGYIILGESESRNTRIFNRDKDIYLIRLDRNYNVEWTRLYEYPEKEESAYDIKELKDGSFIITGNQLDKIYLMKIDMHGNKIWDNLLGRGPEKQLVDRNIAQSKLSLLELGIKYREEEKLRKNNPLEYYKQIMKQSKYVETMVYFTGEGRIVQPENNGFIIIGLSAPVKTDEYSFPGIERPFNEISVIRTDSKGDSISGISFSIFDTLYRGSTIKVNHIDQTNDHGFIITGNIISKQNKLPDVFFIKIDNSGFPGFNKTFGGKLKETCNFALQTNDGGYLLVGAINSFDSKRNDVYVVKINSKGELQWEKSFGSSFDEEGIHCALTKDNEYIILSNFYLDQNHSNFGTYLLKITKDGKIEWEKYLIGKTIQKPDSTYNSNTNYSGKYIRQINDESFLITGQVSRNLNDEGWEEHIFLMKVKKPKK